MLLVLALTFSILVVTFSYLRRISKRNPTITRTNLQLTKFYELPSTASPQVLYKQLVSATSEFLEFYEDLLKQIDFIEPLYKDRLVSDEYYERLVKLKKESEMEKMILESELVNINSSNSNINDLFMDAGKIKNKKKMLKIVEDNLFTHKRGVLENELKNKLVMK